MEGEELLRGSPGVHLWRPSASEPELLAEFAAVLPLVSLSICENSIASMGSEPYCT